MLQELNFEDLKTPCFIIDKDELQENILGFKTALEKYFPNSIFSYSVKTNSLPYILATVKALGGYAEVVSADEYDLAKLIGFSIDKIVYNGPNKTKETFLEAVKGGAFVNIENFREIEWLQTADINLNSNSNIGIRVNINLEIVNNSCEDGGESRFGLSYENGDLRKAIQSLTQLGLNKIGLHLHRSNGIKDLQIYSNLCKYAKKIISDLKFKPSYIDIGGCFYGKMPNKPTYLEYMETIFKELNGLVGLYDIKLIIEPGNAIIASPVNYLLKILDTKNIGENIVCQTDGTRLDVDPIFHKTSYNIKIYSQAENTTSKTQLITGSTCMEQDILLKLDNSKILQKGDKLSFRWVGAYTSTLTPNFINLLPNIYEKQGNNYFNIRKKWTSKEWVQNNVWKDL